MRACPPSGGSGSEPPARRREQKQESGDSRKRCRDAGAVTETQACPEGLLTTVPTEPLTPRGRNKEDHLLALDLRMKVADS